MKTLTVFVFILSLSLPGVCQQSNVSLSSLTVMDVVDPSAGEMNSFMIMFSVNDPASLSRIEIVLEDKRTGVNTTVQIPALIVDNKAGLKFGMHHLPFEEGRITFAQKVRDQFREPYQAVMITGYDNTGKSTNTLTHTRNR